MPNLFRLFVRFLTLLKPVDNNADAIILFSHNKTCIQKNLNVPWPFQSAQKSLFLILTFNIWKEDRN